MLTYHSPSPLSPGTIVQISVRNRPALGIVMRPTPKPIFPTKELVATQHGTIRLPDHSIRLMEWLKDYYPAPLGVIAQHFLPKSLPANFEHLERSPAIKHQKLPVLTYDQLNALSRISETGTHLVHGETGTGKTRVYIELARRSLSAGKSAIVLTPEIGLTSQLANDFRSAFGNRVIVLHSQLTDKIRRDIWLTSLRAADPVIIIGARSAIFTPLKSIGLIVIDESHEPAYKQDKAPHYHAARVAGKLAELTHACMVLGSATPLVADYFLANVKARPIVRLTQIAAKGDSTQETVAEVIDMRNRSNFTHNSQLSNELISGIRDALARKEQALLYLNRRGTARVVFCEECGWQAACPRCNLPLVYHGDAHIMRCHGCDFSAAAKTSCPDCKNINIVFRGAGTKAIAGEVAKLFPEAKIMRFDTDNKKMERIEQHYDSLRNGDIDILIGTQTLAKGLDLPKLSLVGVVNADTSLYFPDFSSRERTYELLSQVFGRVGRGHRSSKVIVQTYLPENSIIKAAIKRDWQTFYASELLEREQFLFPPYCYVLKVVCRRLKSDDARQAMEKFIDGLKTTDPHMIIEGPAPAFYEKIRNKYQWQAIIKARERIELTKIINTLPANWSYDIDPTNLL